MLTVFPDEALQSYILRVVISQGLEDNRDNSKYCNILDGFPVELMLTKEQQDIFKDFSVLSLMKLLKEHILVEGYSMYFNPKLIAAICGRVFFNRKSYALCNDRYFFPGTHLDISFVRFFSECFYSVSYCPECIKYQIQEYGTGWIKLDWMLMNGCTVHGLNLVDLKQCECSCRLKFIEQFKFALSGVCPCCGYAGWPKQYIISQPNRYSHGIANEVWFYDKDLRFYVPCLTKMGSIDIPVSDCFNWLFLDWLDELCLGLSSSKLEDLFDLVIIKEIKKYQYYLNQTISLEGYVFHMLRVFEKHGSSIFNDFLEENTEIIKVDCSDVVPGEVVVNYRVSKYRNCASGNEGCRYCP